MTDEKRDLDAAERALGTLPSTGEDETDVVLRAAWERRLAPLLDRISTQPPPPGLFDRITDRIANERAVTDLVAVRRRLSRWKSMAALAAAAAAALAIFAAQPLFAPTPRYVAVVTSDSDGTAGLIVQLDSDLGGATIIPVGAVAPAGSSLEMWHLPTGAERPRSLGLLPGVPEIRRQFVAGPGDLFAISVEPLGGSPTGQPTQAVYHGRVVQID